MCRFGGWRLECGGRFSVAALYRFRYFIGADFYYQRRSKDCVQGNVGTAEYTRSKFISRDAKDISSSKQQINDHNGRI